MFILVDCNNFFVSCERIFNPKLENQPVIILSNNDGCVIARSNEAKSLGIEMGVAFFKIKDLVQKHSIFVFSSNYSLYGDISRRIMNNLREFSHAIEEYSIDEAFLDLSKFHNNINLEKYCIKIKAAIKRNIGVPVSIGIAKTKTLAKIANYIAKNHTSSNVFQIDFTNIEEVLAHFPIDKIWGIGKKISSKLNTEGVTNALDLRQLNSKALSINLQKIIYELREFPCFKLEDASLNKTILSSRSFYSATNNKDALKEALASYITKACEKLRLQEQLCKGFTIFLKTDKSANKSSYSSKNISYELPEAVDDTRIFIKYAYQCLEKIFQENLFYTKIGVMLFNLTKKSSSHNLLNHFFPSDNNEIMKAIDRINGRYGRNTIYLAAQGIKQEWTSKASLQSRNFTKISQLLEVK